eukprot:6819559-Prymnesium_polylepis.2
MLPVCRSGWNTGQGHNIRDSKHFGCADVFAEGLDVVPPASHHPCDCTKPWCMPVIVQQKSHHDHGEQHGKTYCKPNRDPSAWFWAIFAESRVTKVLAVD